MDPQTSEFFRDAGNVLFGWALGLGSAAFLDWRKSRSRTKAVKVAVSRELRETAYRLLLLVYKLGGRHGQMNRELLQWMRPEVERYAGPNPKDGMMAGVAGLLNRPDPELESFAAHLQANTPVQFVPLEEPMYTTAAIAEMHEHDPDYSVRVLDILAHLRMFNEIRENGLYHTRVTFTPGLSVENYENAVGAVSHAERQMVIRARIIVDKITALEAKYPQDG